MTSTRKRSNRHAGTPKRYQNGAKVSDEDEISMPRTDVGRGGTDAATNAPQLNNTANGDNDVKINQLCEQMTILMDAVKLLMGAKGLNMNGESVNNPQVATALGSEEAGDSGQQGGTGSVEGDHGGESDRETEGKLDMVTNMVHTIMKRLDDMQNIPNQNANQNPTQNANLSVTGNQTGGYAAVAGEMGVPGQAAAAAAAGGAGGPGQSQRGGGGHGHHNIAPPFQTTGFMQRLHDEKQNNMIVFKLPEDDETTADEQNTNDISHVNRILTDMNMEHIQNKVMRVQRLGQWNREGPNARPLKVIFECRTFREMAVRHAYRLKYSEEYKNRAFLSRDYTKEERIQARIRYESRRHRQSPVEPRQGNDINAIRAGTAIVGNQNSPVVEVRNQAHPQVDIVLPPT